MTLHTGNKEKKKDGENETKRQKKEGDNRS